MQITDETGKLISELSRCLNLSPVLAELLVKRGISSVEEGARFLEPKISDLMPPEALAGIGDAAELIVKHIGAGSDILIFGDYDSDGIGASAILYLTLKDLGANVEVFIPTRIDDGYGLSLETLKKITAQKKIGLLITVDCGIGSIEEIAYARSLGIDSIVTDHHEPLSVLPNCIAVNPKTQINAPEYCGAGVAYKLVEKLCGKQYAERYLDICAVSTIADLVPLTGDNRIIARYGLKQLSGGNVRPGFRALLRASGQNPSDAVSSSDVAYRLAPRLNASGRLSKAEKSFKLITTDDPYLASAIAAELELENKQRQELCAKTIADARERLYDYDLAGSRIIVLCDPDWEGGVIGIAATKIAEEFKRPTVLFSAKDGVLKGSCRSIPGINIHDVIAQAGSVVIQFGGHTMAAGLSIKPENLDKFREITNDYIMSVYPDEIFKDSVTSDAEVDFGLLTEEFASELTRFEPFGMNNQKPVFSAESGALPFVRIKSLNHIKCKLHSSAELVAFNFLPKLTVLKTPMKKRLYFTIEKDVFQNRVTVKCTLNNFVLQEITPDAATLILRYADRFLPRAPGVPKGGQKTIDGLYGVLKLVSSLETFERLREEFPEYAVALGGLSSPNPYNTILLAAEPDGNYGYYSRIDVYDDPPECFINYLKSSYNAEIRVFSGKPSFSMDGIKVSRDDAAAVYTYIKAYKNGKKCLRSSELYSELAKEGYGGSEVKFELALKILWELGTVVFDKDGCISVCPNKVSLGDSAIFRLAGE